MMNALEQMRAAVKTAYATQDAHEAINLKSEAHFLATIAIAEAVAIIADPYLSRDQELEDARLRVLELSRDLEDMRRVNLAMAADHIKLRDELKAAEEAAA